MPRPATPPFDAILLVSFGGPLGPDDIRPFLQNVLRGRRIPPARIEEVAHHYQLFDGVSPLTAFTMAQASGLRAGLAARGMHLPVYVGMRNWTPLLPDVLEQMAHDGVSRAVGVLAAAHRSYSSCTQYRHNVLQANEEAVAAGRRPVDVTYVGDWHLHPGFIEAVADHVRQAQATLSEPDRHRARVAFTAHSIPVQMAGSDMYRAQLRSSAQGVASVLGLVQDDWALVYQSRSGRPEDPWLGPDINEWLRQHAADGRNDPVVICPLGFVCDHIEVLYDLDREARETCSALGIRMARAAAANAHPAFIAALVDAVISTCTSYANGRPLPLVSSEHPNSRELPPPVRPARESREAGASATVSPTVPDADPVS